MRAPALAAGSVHVWTADLDAPPSFEPDAWLSADERARAERYRQARDRRRFVRRRGWLRRILGDYLGRPPGAVRLLYGPHGQPRAADGDWLQFSVSQADGRALCALTTGRRLGADLARLRPGRADDAVARALLAPGEIAGLQALPPASRGAAFLRCWTRKEAYVKALGGGLALPLDAFEVSLGSERWTRLVGCALAPRDVARWRFLLLAPFADFVASIAVEAPASGEAA